jgi:hypothetical protein
VIGQSSRLRRIFNPAPDQVPCIPVNVGLHGAAAELRAAATSAPPAPPREQRDWHQAGANPLKVSEHGFERRLGAR